MCTNPVHSEPLPTPASSCPSVLNADAHLLWGQTVVRLRQQLCLPWKKKAENTIQETWAPNNSTLKTRPCWHIHRHRSQSLRLPPEGQIDIKQLQGSKQGWHFSQKRTDTGCHLISKSDKQLDTWQITQTPACFAFLGPLRFCLCMWN